MFGREEADTSDFASQGTVPFPYTYNDNKRLAEVSDWPDALLHAKQREYEEFLQRQDIMQRARTVGHRILRHLTFEIEYRKGPASLQQWVTLQQLEADCKVEDEGTKAASV